MSNKRPETRLAHAGKAQRLEGAINPPIQRGSTVLVPAEELYGETKTYGLEGFAVHDALREALAETSGAAGCTLAPSGLAACTLPLLAFLRAGDDLLVTDSVYGPTRRFCDGMLKRLGVATRYYDPRIGSGIDALIQPNTRAIFLESPGSLTFEVQDVPAIAAIARARGVKTLIDDTWSAGVLFKPFAHGVDVSIQALTKYQAGHSDVLLGAVMAATAADQKLLYNAAKELGTGCGAAEDAYLTLRGMRTMHVRMERQASAGLEVAQWLATNPAVARVLHPSLPSHPDHALFTRDFAGPAGLFGVVLKPCSEARVLAMLNALDLFGLGFSWAGFESLAVHCDPQIKRTAAPWTAEGPLVRLSIGLEHPSDLIADLEQAFTRLAG